MQCPMLGRYQCLVLLLLQLVLVGTAIPRGASVAQLAERRLDAAEELRVSSYEHEHSLFSDLADLAVDSEGRIYVLAHRAMAIAVLDSDGTHLRTIDLRNATPFRFLGPSRIGLAHDSLWVLDPAPSRITWLSLEGAFRGTMTVLTTWRDSVGTGNRLAGPLADGLFYGAPTIMSPVAARGLVRKVPFLRMDQAGNVVDTLVWLDVMPHQTAVMEIEPDGEPAYMSQPIKDLTLMRPAPGGEYIVIADRRSATDYRVSAFTVRKIGVAGDTLAEIAIPYVPVALTMEYVDALVAAWFDGAAPFGGRVDRAKYRSAIWKPKYLPPLEQLVVGTDGSIWLGLLRIAGPGRGEQDWLVLSPALNERYRVNLPAELTVMQASLRKVWGVVTDSLGVRHVCRFRLGPVRDDA